MDWTAIPWFLLMLLFFWMEATTISLVSIWFAFGALAAIIASLCGAEFWLECVIFIGVAVLALAALRPVVKKFINPKLEKTNIDAIIGTTGRVLCPIDNRKETGRVKLGGMEWSARSTDGSPIEEETIVRVDRIEGAKVFVSVVK